MTQWMLLNAFAIPFELIVSIIHHWLADNSKKGEFAVLMTVLSLVSLGFCIILWNMYAKVQQQPRTVAFNSPYNNNTTTVE